MPICIKILTALLIAYSLYFSGIAAKAETTDPFAACGVTGSTTLYDLKNGQWYKTNSNDADLRSLPASTFKIFHSLIALDMQVTSPEDIFEWDGTEHEIDVWNQDTMFKDAFKNSTLWVYESLTKRIHINDYKRYLDWAEYNGNDDIVHGRDGNFWVYGNWGVSPVEQINMLVKLYNNDLPFSRASMETVKGFMQQDNKNVFGKSGWTRRDGKNIGWWVGYKIHEGQESRENKENRTAIFFATRIFKNEKHDIGNFIECRKTITEKVIERFFNAN